MKHIILYLFCLLFITSATFAQKKAFNLKEDASKWSFLMWAEGQDYYEQAFNSSRFPIVVEDTIYIAQNFFHNYIGENVSNYGYCGYSIKKINKTTGYQYWDITKLYLEFGERKRLGGMQLIDHDLVVTLFDEKLVSPYTIWVKGFPGHLIIDTQSGKIKDSVYMDKSDPNLYVLSLTSYPIFVDDTEPILFKTSYGYLYKTRNYSTKGYLLNHIDQNGKLLSIDSIPYPEYMYGVNNFHTMQTDDAFWNVILTRNDRYWQERQAIVAKYDKDMNLEFTHDVADYIEDPFGDLGIEAVKDNYFILHTIYYIPDVRDKRHVYYLFNGQGELIDKLTYVLIQGVDNDPDVQYINLHPIVDEIHQRIILARSSQQKPESNAFLEFFVSQNDTVQSLNKVEVEKSYDHFSILWSQMMNNGDILIHFQQVLVFDIEAPRWYGWAMIDGQKMNVITGTKDITKPQSYLKIFPNPTSNILHIVGLTSPAHVTIFDIYGTVVRDLNGIETSVDLGDLPEGMYILDIKNKEVNERHKVIRVK